MINLIQMVIYLIQIVIYLIQIVICLIQIVIYLIQIVIYLVQIVIYLTQIVIYLIQIVIYLIQIVIYLIQIVIYKYLIQMVIYLIQIVICLDLSVRGAQYLEFEVVTRSFFGRTISDGKLFEMLTQQQRRNIVCVLGLCWIKQFGRGNGHRVRNLFSTRLFFLEGRFKVSQRDSSSCWELAKMPLIHEVHAYVCRRQRAYTSRFHWGFELYQGFRLSSLQQKCTYLCGDHLVGMVGPLLSKAVFPDFRL